MIVSTCVRGEDASHGGAQQGSSKEVLGRRMDLDGAHWTACSSEHTSDGLEDRGGSGWSGSGLSGILGRSLQQGEVEID